MTSATSSFFSPMIAEVIDEAYERVGLDPAKITDRHIASARRSMNFMLSYWTSRGMLIQMVDVCEVELEQGQVSLQMPRGAYDVIDATLRREGVDISMHPLARHEYEDLPTKDDLGLPDRFFVDRSEVPPVISIWQRPSQAGDVFRFWYFRQPEEVGPTPAGLKMPAYYFEAFASGLAYRLATKYSPRAAGMLYQVAEDSFREAMRRDSSRADLRMPNRYGRRR